MIGQPTYAKISDVALILTGKNIDKEKLNAEGKGLPYIVGASSMRDGKLKCDRYCEAADDKAMSRMCDVVISTVGTLGKLAVNDIGDCVLSNHACAVRFVPSILPEYGLLCLEASIAAAIAEYETGLTDAKTGFGRKLDVNVIGDLPLCVMTIDRQKETADRMVALAESFSVKDSPKIQGQPIPDFDNLRELEAHVKRDSQRLYDQHRKSLKKLGEFIRELDAGDNGQFQLSLFD